MEPLVFKLSIAERIAAAWAAFKVNHRLEAYADFRARCDAALQVTLAKMDPFDRAMIDSIAGATANAAQLLGQVMPKIEELAAEDQVQIVKHLCRGNPQIILNPLLRAWSAKNVKVIAASTRSAA